MIKWRKIHPGQFRIDYLAGMKLSVLARRYECSVQSVKRMSRVLGLPPRRAGRRPASAPIPIPIPFTGYSPIPGDVVILTMPDAPKWDGMPATVMESRAWGARVAVRVFHSTVPYTVVVRMVANYEMRFVGKTPPIRPNSVLCPGNPPN